MSKASETTVGGLCWNVAGSTACWTALYMALSKSKSIQQSPEFVCRLVTVGHALVAVFLSSACHWQGPNAYTTPGISALIGGYDLSYKFIDCFI